MAGTPDHANTKTNCLLRSDTNNHKLPTTTNKLTTPNHVESHAYQAWGRPLTRAPNRDHYTRLLQQRRHVLVARKRTKGKEMPRATCTGTSERKKKERNNKTKQIVGNKVVLRQHAPQRSVVVERVQSSDKVKSQTLRMWPLPTRRWSTDSSSMPHLSAELLILPLPTILTSRATRRQRYVAGSRPPFLLDSADFRSILSTAPKCHTG